MKRSTNKIQRDYIAAKALAEALGDQKKQMEQAYIAAHNIVNSDGIVPKRIYYIEDDEVFEQANEESSAEIDACGLTAARIAANETLKAAEDKLIDYGLSIAPVGVRATLERGAKNNHTIRQKLIDLVLRLDVSTV